MSVAVACLHCGSLLPAGSRKDARFCSVKCRVAAHRAGRSGPPGGAHPIRDADGALWCPACSRPAPFGRIVDGALVLIGTSSGGFSWDGSSWRWSIYARADARATLPATIACPRCRELLSVTG